MRAPSTSRRSPVPMPSSTSPLPESATSGGQTRTRSRSSTAGSTGPGPSRTRSRRSIPSRRSLVSAAAIGYYGDTGTRAVDETAPPGPDFSAQVVVAWEAAADEARAAGVRVVHPRSGLVMSRDGGAWDRMSRCSGSDSAAGWATGGSTLELHHPRRRGACPAVPADLGPLRPGRPHRPRAGDQRRAHPGDGPGAAPAHGRGRARVRAQARARRVLHEVLRSLRVLPHQLEKAGFEFRHPTSTPAVATLS